MRKHIKGLIENLNLLSQKADFSLAHFCEKEKGALSFKKYFFKSNLLEINKIRTLVHKQVNEINQLPFAEFVDDDKYTALFVAVQKFNQLAVRMPQALLFNDLGIEKPLAIDNCPQAAPTTFGPLGTSKIDVPQSQQIHMSKGGWSGKADIYHYNEADLKITHRGEVARIVYHTNKEKFRSFLGNILKFLGSKNKVFNESHFFRNHERIGSTLFAGDEVLSVGQKPTSYWMGHASCFLNIPVSTEFSVNIITDPVEEDINIFFVPRMTPVAKQIEQLPVVHIFLLSHNHLDHFQKKSIRKLVNAEPLVIVPRGDKDKLTRLGFKNVHEFIWWETSIIPLERKGHKGTLKITTVPANHWSGHNLFNFYQSAFMGYVLHQEEGDIYYAGDTARLSKEHLDRLVEGFDIRCMFQPGGPDELRKDMVSAHQASVDALWMHFRVPMATLYKKKGFQSCSKSEFIVAAQKYLTLFIHLKTYKLGNVHFDDTERGIEHIKDLLSNKASRHPVHDYEKALYQELLAEGKKFVFRDNSYLNAEDILAIIDAGIVIPQLGSRTELLR